MKKILKLIVCLLISAVFILPVSATENNIWDKEKELNQGNYVSTNNAIEWVVMFYQCGDNALSSGISVNLNLIGKVGATDNVKIAVLIDKKPLNDTILYYYDGITPVKQEWPAESDLSDPDTLVAFVGKVKDDYPSARYCLEITANKGSGWQGICYDEHGDELMITMPELFDALDVITDNGCVKLDVLLLQTCLGGNLEVRYHVRQFVHYFVSYADCGLVPDFPFDAILAEVVANPLMTAEQFAITVVDLFTPVQYQNIYQAVGATDETKLDELANSIDELAELFLQNSDTYNGHIQIAVDETRKYGLQFNIDYYIDLQDFLEHLAIDDPAFVQIKDKVLDCIEEAVVAKVTLEGYPSCGFNFYFPKTKNDYNNALRYDHALPASYEETLFAIDTHWDEFLKEYLDLSSNTPPSIPTIEGPANGKTTEEHEYKLSANDAQADNISFYIDWGDSTYQMNGMVSSGSELSVVHTWASDGTYEIKAKAIDQYGADSDWATLTVKMPLRSQTLLERIIECILQFFSIPSI